MADDHSIDHNDDDAQTESENELALELDHSHLYNWFLGETFSQIKRGNLSRQLERLGFDVILPNRWSMDGLLLADTQQQQAIYKTREFAEGKYMVQDLSSFLPVIALDPQVNERILEIAAASGDKTTYIAAIMNNTGRIFANTLNKDWLGSLDADVGRMGVTNTTRCNCEVSQLPIVFPDMDRVLLDAPCSRTGRISEDKSIKLSITAHCIKNFAALQKKLLLSAIDSVKIGGYIVYSTSSILLSENEDVVYYALKHRDVKIVPCGLDFGVAGFVQLRKHQVDPSLARTRRFYPHVHDIEGCFVVKLQKMGNAKKPDEEGRKRKAKTTGEDEAQRKGKKKKISS